MPFLGLSGPGPAKDAANTQCEPGDLDQHPHWNDGERAAQEQSGRGGDCSVQDAHQGVEEVPGRHAEDWHQWLDGQ